MAYTGTYKAKDESYFKELLLNLIPTEPTHMNSKQLAEYAGLKSREVIEKCIKTSYERNYKYITPPEWLQNKNTSYNGNGKCSKELAWRTHEQMEESEKKRQEFFEKVRNNDPSIHHF